jgi:UDP-N-acetylglucosamine diphosphorylase/glucosamine-1-phosphate N-acetyltransferase
LSQPFILQVNEVIRQQLFPFTMLRETADLRIGILTIREKWEHLLAAHRDAVSMTAFPSNWIPSAEWATNRSLWTLDSPSIPHSTYRLLERPWQMPVFNHWAICEDFTLLTRGRTSLPIPAQVRLTGPDAVFIEHGARLEHCFLNTTEGPIYIGRDARIQEGAMLRGPLAICEGALVKMGAALYGGTTIGRHAVAGGEIKNAILSDYANKGHHGYLGDAVVGEWCNIGAGTSCSNVKNNAGTVRVMDMASGTYLPAGGKCGLLMGDFSRAAINTSFNTGTVTGICANVFDGSALTPKFIPSFSWGGRDDERCEIDKEIISITAWMRMKGVEPDPGLLNRIRKTYSTNNP